MFRQYLLRTYKDTSEHAVNFKKNFALFKKAYQYATDPASALNPGNQAVVKKMSWEINERERAIDYSIQNIITNRQAVVRSNGNMDEFNEDLSYSLEISIYNQNGEQKYSFIFYINGTCEVKDWTQKISEDRKETAKLVTNNTIIKQQMQPIAPLLKTLTINCDRIVPHVRKQLAEFECLAE
ncbi:MAG: hypothetical protein JW841_00865 [Deltaproteobacteria bacterium]|nr:hypothetical protein [Deltaproteobacteria bacterium]